MYRLQLKEIQEYAEEKLLFEEMSAASDIMFATSSDTVGREFSQKWSGEFSTKECGEPSHVMFPVSWRARLSQMFAQSFHVRWRLVFFLSGSRLLLYSFAFGVFPLKLSFVFSCIWHVLTCHAVIFLVCAFIFCMSHGTARDPLKEMQQKNQLLVPNGVEMHRKKKVVACSWQVGSCDPCRVVLSVNEFVVCCPWVIASSCCSYRTEMAKRKLSDECVPRLPGTPPESGSGESSRKSYIWRLYRTATWSQPCKHLLHMHNAPEEK